MSIIPAVARDGATGEFFDATAKGVYLIRRCVPHAHASKPQAIQCSICASEDLRWEASSGEAKLISWAVLPTASVVAIAELKEGPWMWATLLCDNPAELQEGMALRVAFERPPGSEAIPVLEPA